ncbi:hypothetical protein AB0L40_05945 [Patulibacter sp. NPDC049589]|uniref:hypothetical protein n=1 Tax=Patulibacter sp. NPDC049589 TaxID=3154731 RepID=UPI0034289E19
MPTPRTAAPTEKIFPALSNLGYFSDYYLTHRLDAGLGELHGRWDKSERVAEPTARTRVRTLSRDFDRSRVQASSTSPDASVLDQDRFDLGQLPADGVRALQTLNRAVLGALGWDPDEREPVELTSGDKTLTVPVAHRCETPEGVLLVALETVFGTDPAALVASRSAPAGRLLDPVLLNGKPAGHTVLDAAQLIFTSDDPPGYILVVSGGAVTLLDRERWGEGVSLGANLEDALARHDVTAKGELAAIAALFSSDAINPGDGAESTLAKLLDRASNESAGVSKELRHGIRRSVELLAKAVVADVRYRRREAWTTIDPQDLTRQSLRYLYRIIVLLFAEARPELGILPSDDPDYQAGYSVARLRDTALVDLQTDHAKNARHLQASLDVLFRLVNDGHEAAQALDGDGVRDLTFPGLRSSLFGTEACPLIDRTQLRDETLQEVIANLCFTRERTGAPRRPVSYSTLGINQLGAVYEGLMAYSGFLATEPLYELDKDGDPDNGSWVIPVDRAAEFADDLFLTEERHDGSRARVRYEEGEFVFRLSGRDRQRSASYYTPEILTEFTVRHALDVLFQERPGLDAAGILDLTVCEPALGSGAFLNEAITQLSVRYLKAAQDEAGETIDPDRYQLELQRAKAHFAVNQAFGVDLNQTAVELAEVSLWLGSMHAGLQAPWFGGRLRAGNSLVGARRATYTLKQVGNAAWTGAAPQAPKDRALRDVPLGSAADIHHFLLPGQGWGAAAEADEVRELAAEWTDDVKRWRARVLLAPNKRQTERLGALATRVEQLWAESLAEVQGLWSATRQHVDVWGAATPAGGRRFGDEAIRRVLSDPRSATTRLRTLMDAWCALWLWSPQHGVGLPTFDEWLATAEALLRIDEPWQSGVLFADEGALPLPAGSSIDDVTSRHPWLAQARGIAEQQRWFHWELEFSPVFAAGGFDLQVGNPPWVRPRWSDADALAEADPWFGVTSPMPETERSARRSAALQDGRSRARYLAERAENAGLNACFGAVTREELLGGQQTNLYFLFITGAWRRAKSAGAIALMHPEGHLGDPNAATLRAAAYRHYRAHYHFINELQLFSEISHTKEYGVHVYSGDRGHVEFVQSAFVYHPSVIDRSVDHDGTGELPGRKLATGGWDVRPHRERLVTVDADVLAAWAKLLAYSVPESAPVVKSVTTAEAAAVEAIAKYPHRLGDATHFWTRGFDEQTAPRRGLIEERTAVPASWDEVILQGPHVGICLPFAKQPRVTGRHQQDYAAWDLASLPETVVPRTNWQRKANRADFDKEIAEWDGTPNTERFRLMVRRQIASNTARSVFGALIPPRPSAVSVCYLGGLTDDRQTVAFTGLLAGILADFFVRVSGATDLHSNVVARFPISAEDEPLAAPLVHRTLRLNALTREYAPLWEGLVHSDWDVDEFTNSGAATRSLAAPPKTWNMGVPVRGELDRWLLLTELDALGALIVGVDVEALTAVYRSQFPVLLGYEHQMLFDARGRQLCGDWHQYGFVQAQIEAEAKASGKRGWKKVWPRVQAYIDGDTDVDLGPFVPPFTPADREKAMSHAYRTFAERYEIDVPAPATPGTTREPA